MDSQGEDNYYNLALNQETSRYLYRIIALKLICSNPSSYGYYLRIRDLYPLIPTYTVKMDSGIINLADFAKKNKVSYKMLKEFNPWLRDKKLNNKTGKNYIISLPVKAYVYYSKLLLGIKNADSVVVDTNNVKIF